MRETEDDFSAFSDARHMFFGLKDPFALIRSSTESVLRGQVSDAVLERIVTHPEPKFLTLGREKTGWFRKQVLVTHFGCCVRATLYVVAEGGTRRDVLSSTLTFLFGNLDTRGSESSRAYVDFHDDAANAFTDEAFKQRFLEFRLESLPEGAR